MNHNTIKKLQKDYGFASLQALIDSGMAWKMEGSVGRAAMGAIRSGACMLAKVTMKDYYGSHIPSRYQVQKGTNGSYQNSVAFWSNEDNYLYL